MEGTHTLKRYHEADDNHQSGKRVQFNESWVGSQEEIYSGFQQDFSNNSLFNSAAGGSHSINECSFNQQTTGYPTWDGNSAPNEITTFFSLPGQEICYGMVSNSWYPNPDPQLLLTCAKACQRRGSVKMAPRDIPTCLSSLRRGQFIFPAADTPELEQRPDPNSGWTGRSRAGHGFFSSTVTL